jgi:hypothetical protein
MNPADGLLDELASAGVRLWVEDGRIRFRAPAGVMTEERKRAIKAREAAIIALIEERSADRGETISRIPDAERYEPSPGQRRLWILEKLEGASAAYNVPLLHWLDGPLDVDALRAAFERIMARHESLRTIIVSDAGVPFQRVATGIALPFEFHDHGRAADPEAAAIEAARSFIVRPFDLGRGPLSGIALHRIASERHLLAVSFHHAVADGVSIAVLGREIGEFYAAIRTGRAPCLPELRLQYRDYAAWRNRMIEAPEGFASARRYWIERLAPPIPTLDLPADFPRPAVQGFAGAEETFVLDAATSAAFKDLCRRRGATLFMGLVAAVKALLHRYTGAPEIIVGTPVAGRDHVDFEPLIGLFINTLVLRDTVDGGTPFADLLASVARNAGEAFDHADYPFDLLVSDLALDRDLGRSPIFDVMIILQNQQPGDSGLAIERIAATPVYEHTGTSKFDLTFNFHEFAEGITAAIEYRTDLFRAARIRRMGDHLAAFVRGVIAAPETPIGRIEMRSGEERALIETWGTRSGGYRLDRTPIELFTAQAAARPDAVAVEDGNEKLS